MTEREKLAARIRALRAKTVENDCTEGEAVAAAELLAKLLQQYNMTLDEAEMRASPFERHRETHDDPVGERLWKVARAVADLTGARYWVNRPGEPPTVNFFGFAHEVEVARYMLEICRRAMLGEQDRLQRETWPRTLRRRQLLPYLDGMADRLAERIAALKPPAPTGKGLIVLHGQLIDLALADAGIKLQDGRARSSRDWEDSYRDGRAAGDRVALNRGLGGGQATRGLLG